MLAVLIVIGLASLLWVVLSFNFVNKGTLQLPIWKGKPYPEGISQGWHFFWFGPLIKFITIEKEQKFELNFQISIKSKTVKIKINLEFSLTTESLPQIWQRCNDFSHRNIERVISNLLRPVVKQKMKNFTLYQLQNDPERFREDLQTELEKILVEPFKVEWPEITEVIFSFPEKKRNRG